MTTMQETIEEMKKVLHAQEELIIKYREVVNSYKNSQDSLYAYISQIYKLFTTGDPNAEEIALSHLEQLAQKAEK